MSGEVDVTVVADCKEVVEALEASVDMASWIQRLFCFLGDLELRGFPPQFYTTANSTRLIFELTNLPRAPFRNGLFIRAQQWFPDMSKIENPRLRDHLVQTCAFRGQSSSEYLCLVS